MRVFAVATILLLSSSLVPSFAQDEGKAPTPNQPQTVPVQPERSPQQSDQMREEDRRGNEDRQISSDWRARPSDSNRDSSMGHMGQMRRDMDRDHRTMRMRPEADRADRDGYGGGSYDEDRPRLRRVKVCFEYENGDEYCRYRR
jgi:hypothetical protein